MKKIILFSLILFCLPAISFAWTDVAGSTLTTTGGDYDIGDIANDIYDSDQGAVKVLSDGATFYLTESQLELLQYPTAYLTVSQLELLQYPTAYLTESQLKQLLAESTVYLTISQLELIQRPTIYMNTPAPSYKNQTIFISSGTAGKITSATSATITVSDKVSSFSFLYKSPTTEYAIIKTNHLGGQIELGDGDTTEPVEVKTAQAITFEITNIVEASSMTYVVTTEK